MFCREQVAQLRDALSDIHSAGAELVVIGSGTPFHARGFRDERELTFPVLVDPERAAFAAAELKRGGRSVANLKTFKAARRAMKAGFKQGRTQGDPWQQGGVFVFGPGDATHYAYVSAFGGDHPAVDEVLGALAAVAS